MEYCCLDAKTIREMERRGASQGEIDWARRTQNSMDANDVVRHRELIKKYNPGDPWREPNNFVLHPNTYEFGEGRRSPQFIGGMIGGLGYPVVLHGTPQPMKPEIAPHIIWRQ